VLYLDASAVMKLVVEEPESAALRELVELERSRASSELLLAEIPRAVRRRVWPDATAEAPALVARGERELAAMYLIAVTRSILALAGTLEGPLLRALDAVHMATAMTYPAGLTAFVSYDDRQLEAADRAALPVASPGR
jgi:predicted nucleic acid-binding protein